MNFFKYFDFQLLIFYIFLLSMIAILIDKFFLKPKNIKNKLATAISYIGTYFNVLLIVFIIRSFVLESFHIPTSSMYPTLQPLDNILVNKFTYGIRIPIINKKIIEISDIKRGDIVVFKYPLDPKIYYIKRVIGIPGDTVQYDLLDKRYLINGKILEQTKFDEDIFEGDKGFLFRENNNQDSIYTIRKIPNRINGSGITTTYQKIPEGYYFMSGDNRDNSSDSRYWFSKETKPSLQGLVSDDLIIGKAFFVWFSTNLTHFGFVK